jgi:hypothetical protein
MALGNFMINQEVIDFGIDPKPEKTEDMNELENEGGANSR